MKKILEIEVVKATSETITIRITKQSHRCSEFGAGEYRFNTPKSPIEIRSDCEPDFVCDDVLYVCGEYSSEDNNIIEIPSSNFLYVLTAIEAYNAFDFPNDNPPSGLHETCEREFKLVCDIETKFMDKWRSQPEVLRATIDKMFPTFFEQFKAYRFSGGE